MVESKKEEIPVLLWKILRNNGKKVTKIKLIEDMFFAFKELIIWNKEQKTNT